MLTYWCVQRPGTRWAGQRQQTGATHHEKRYLPRGARRTGGGFPGGAIMPTIEEILGRRPEPIPEWLDGTDPPRFDRAAFFASRTVYYPGSGEDGQPLKLCNRSRSAHCFVYVDQDDIYEQDGFRGKLRDPDQGNLLGYERGILGYGLARWEPVPVDVLIPGGRDGWTPVCDESHRIGLERRYSIGKDVGKKTFAFFAVMDRMDGIGDVHGPRRLAILFIGGDGFALYDALYCQGNGTPPPFLAVIQDHGFGGQWPGKCFGGDDPLDKRDGLLDRIARKSGVLPEFLLVGDNTTPWVNYADTGAVPEPGGQHGHPRRLLRREGIRE